MGLPKDTQNVISTFKEFDANGDGVISKDELRTVLSKVAPDLTSEQVQVLLCAADLNGDGVIQYSEFVNWLQGATTNLRQVIQKKTVSAMVCEAGIDRQAIDGFIADLEKDRRKVSNVLPSIPRSIAQDVSGKEFESKCLEGFREADKSGNSVLDFAELFPLLLNLCEKHPFTIDTDMCMKLTKFFDVDRNGFISSEDAVEFARFVLVLGYLYAAREVAPAAARPPITVYYWGPFGGMNIYGRAIAIYLTLNQAGVEYMMKGPQDMPDGAGMAVPAVDIDGVCMAQTLAILLVLGGKFGLAGQTFEERMRVRQALQDMSDVCGETVSGKLLADEARKKKWFTYLDKKLDGKKWMGGTELPTVADFHGVFTFEWLKKKGIDFSGFPNTVKWWADIQAYPVVAKLYASCVDGRNMLPPDL